LPDLLNQVDDDVIIVTHVGPANAGTAYNDVFPTKPSLAVDSGR